VHHKLLDSPTPGIFEEGKPRKLEYCCFSASHNSITKTVTSTDRWLRKKFLRDQISIQLLVLIFVWTCLRRLRTAHKNCVLVISTLTLAQEILSFLILLVELSNVHEIVTLIKRNTLPSQPLRVYTLGVFWNFFPINIVSQNYQKSLRMCTCWKSAKARTLK
jgi:hypothetical protein